jgi:lysophospholipase L1-like esterase
MRRVRAFGGARHRSTSVLIFGDSNTWGYNPKPRLVPRRLADGKRWTDRLQQNMNAAAEEGDEDPVRIHVDALNARTTVFTDPTGPCDGEYDCSGRSTFMSALHAHKPLDVVVIALGTNDLKKQMNLGPEQVAAGVKILCKDVERATDIGKVVKDEKGEQLIGPCPEIIVVGVPKVLETPVSLAWGFEGATQKSERTAAMMEQIAEASGYVFVDQQQIPLSPLDGVHFDVDAQEEIAAAVEAGVNAALAKRRQQ